MQDSGVIVSARWQHDLMAAHSDTVAQRPTPMACQSALLIRCRAQDQGCATSKLVQSMLLEVDAKTAQSEYA